MSATLLSKNLRFVVFADGASSGNPGPGGWGTLCVDLQAGHVRELGGGERSTTNNRMELLAVIAALEHLSLQPGDVALHTDSTYVIRGITQWIWGWRNRGWKTAEGNPVANEELWKALSALVFSRKTKGAVSWHWVKGHSGVPGNERVDAIATGYSKGPRPSLYDGPLLGYEYPVLDLPEKTELPVRDQNRAPKAAAYSYLSLVNGICRRHRDWKSCESQVKGRPGARFKKATSAQDEASILRDWKVSPEKVLSADG